MSVPNSEKNRKRILAIDDDPAILLFVRSSLENAGYEVEVAETGPEGLLRLRRSRPDLILLDIEMPGMNGFEVAARIRKRTDDDLKGAMRKSLDTVQSFQIPILFLTARAAVMDVKQAADVGADGYLVKPCQAEDLLRRVNEVLNKSSQGSD